MSDTPGIIPQSQALAEADPSSLMELMSRDPQGFNTQDRGRIVAALRVDRARREEAEKTAAASGASRKKPSAAIVIAKSSGDMGL